MRSSSRYISSLLVCRTIEAGRNCLSGGKQLPEMGRAEPARFGGNVKKYLLRLGSTVALMLVISGCSFLPLPMTIDLKTRLLSKTSDTVSHEIGASEAEDIDFEHPDENGECIDFQDADIPVTVESARLHYDADIDYSGPSLTGNVAAQLYVAPDAASLWNARNKVGPTISIDLRNPDTTLAGTAVLNPDQVEGINAKELCWGLKVTGSDISAAEGKATIDYTIEELKLAIRFSVI
jgi:hypothetical protein